MTRHLDLIGIGPGNPDWLTLAAVDAIQHLDVLFVVLKEHDVDDLVEFRREVLRRHRRGVFQHGHRPDAEAVGLHIVELDRKSTRLNSSHARRSRMPSSA